MLALATIGSARAGGPIRLWNSAGETVEGYGAIVTRMKPGTELLLRGGENPRTVTIGKFLGNGNTSVIYDIGDGRAIRLPRGDGLSPLGPAYSAYIYWFAEGAEHVSETEAPIVKVYSRESAKERYLIVEKLSPPKGVDTLYSLEDLVKGRVKGKKLAEKMTAELLDDFAPATWQLRFVADMRSDQILYTSRGWLIADLSSTVKFAREVRDATLFSAMGKLPISWRLKLEKRVLAARRDADLSGNFGDFLLAEYRRCVGWMKGVVAF